MSFEEIGHIWFRGALNEAELAGFEAVCKTDDRPGERVEWTALSSLLSSKSKLTKLVQKVLLGAKPVRAVAFNKTDASNWLVPWHQDRVIAVKARHDVAGYSNWSRKGGFWHCEPPIELLEPMVFARVHLDHTDEGSGCLEIAPGSHRQGFISASEAACFAKRYEIEPCNAKRGDVLFLKALTLHRSARASLPAQRRTLRIDYSNQALSAPLEWAFGETAP